ncbi:non-ribosomal peptide synthetase [Azospirillum sp. B510]|uniref:non-ribosomal peptide synthetase n=1 Tax=Azospirillum sp. (strain B510) TaxID=137722 RepID=UPI000313CD9A|nr:non-ribosomal peptide synthetase [Azospirillum sp. B510]
MTASPMAMRKFPATSAQERLWLLQSMQPDNSAYTVTEAIRLRGPLDVAVLSGAFAQLVAAHGQLRAVFGLDGDELHQTERVPADVGTEIAFHIMAPEEIDAWLRAETARSFDMAHGPLFRAHLLDLGGNDHLFVLSVHHIVTDGWSSGLFFRQLGDAYRAIRQGRTATPDAGDYMQVVRRERAYLASAAFDADFERAAALLDGRVGPLALPTAGRPSKQPGAATTRRTIPAALDRRLDALARRIGVSKVMLYLAGYGVMLSRFASQPTVAVAVPFLTRDHASDAETYGLQLNTVVVPVDPRRQESWTALLLRMRDVVFAVFETGAVPFDRLMARVGGLPQAMLVVQPDACTVPVFDGVEASWHFVENAHPKFDVLLQIDRASVRSSSDAAPAEELFAAIEHRTDTITPALASRMLEGWFALMGSLADDPDAGIGPLDLTGGEDRAETRALLRADERLPPLDPVTAFADIAARMPEATAIRHDGKSLNYGALARRVAAIRDALVAHGIGPGDFVGVCLHRVPDLIATLLAILDSGAAYVPLDPAYPANRLDFIARDASCALIVGAAATRGVLRDLPAHSLDIADIAGDASPAGFVPTRGHGAETAAYLIYTSGSTGRPKGVIIPRRALWAFIAWSRTVFPADDLACVLASTSICFDLSVFEIFLPLATGGAIRLVETALALVEAPLPAPSLVNTVPSAMAELTRAGALGGATRVVNLAGEPLPRRLCAEIGKLLPAVRLCNLYGPSEDTTYSTWSEVALEDTDEPLIGWPISGTNCYLLDDTLRPVPAGVVGELYLGGKGVALGYLGRPGLTAERFLPDPWLPGRRMYRTGDRAVLMPDGGLRYLGRNDHQVKLRGFRIETPEIESVAERMAGVERALVTLVGQDDARELALYWTGGASEQAVRAALRETLPGFMIPGRFIPLERFPLNANGKIDRARLPAPAGAAAADADPMTPSERRVAALFTEITGSAAAAGTDFFESGGHSLLAMRFIARSQEALGVRLTLAEMFTLRTVRAIAEREERAAAAPMQAPPILPGSGDGPVPLSFAQERLWTVDRLRTGSTMLNIGIGTAVEGPLDVRALRASINALTRRHAGLRLRVGHDAKGRLQQYARSDDRAFLREVTVDGVAARDHALAEMLATPFDLAIEPPARWMLVHEPGRTVLGLVIHHLAADAWSLDVIMRELWEAYEAALGQEPAPPSDAAPVPSTIDYALWQRRLLDDPARRESDLAYWREALADAPERLQLPFDHPPARATSYRGARLKRRLDDAAVDGLAAVARRSGASTFVGLLAVYQALLARLSMQDDIVVGIPVANRETPGAESIVGCLLNTLALRADFSGRPSLAALVGQMQARCMEAYRHQTTPFELIVSALDIRRAVEHTPLVQAMLVFNADLVAERSPAGLALEGIDIPPLDTQYDLTLMIGRDRRGWTARWDYRRDLFDPQTLERIAGFFETLLAEAVRAPHTPLHRLPLGPAGAIAPAPDPAPAPRCLHEMFVEQVARSPEAPALRDADGAMTYRALDGEAEALADRLAASGVGLEDRVAVLLPKSRGSVVAAIAAAKAGAAFLLLDPALPQERLELIVADAGAAVLVTDADGAARLAAKVPRTLRIDGTEARAPRRAAPPISPDSLSYVIYTSGSTGRPKGVLVTHRGLAQLRALHRDAFLAGPGAHVLQYAPPTFDAAVWDMVMALLNGACLHLAPPEELLPGAPLARMLASRGITHLTLPPSNMAMVPPDCGHRLANLVFAGEALPAEIVQRWSGVERVWNGYGPTETTVCATIGRCRAAVGRDAAGTEAPGIGRALAGTCAYVLDEGLNLVPPGLVGELHVGGDGVARGYLGQPARTAQSFLPDPFAARPGARMYRTGDLVRVRPDGELVFVGRADEQVKLRGIRIETGEIEKVLAELDPRIGDVAVVVAGSGSERRLVAFVTGPETVAEAALHAALARKLPGYMVPAAVQRLERFPLTRNGKLDRKALAAAAARPQAAAAHRKPPRGPVETRIAKIWSRLLPGVAIGRDDSFFALGGTSLLMVRLHEELDRQYRGVFKPIDLFRLNTVASIAAELETNGAIDAEDALDLTIRL